MTCSPGSSPSRTTAAARPSSSVTIDAGSTRRAREVSEKAELNPYVGHRLGALVQHLDRERVIEDRSHLGLLPVAREHLQRSRLLRTALAGIRESQIASRTADEGEHDHCRTHA